MIINGGAAPLRASSPQQPQPGELSRRYVALEEQVALQPEGGAGEPNNDVPAGEGHPVDLKRLREKLDGTHKQKIYIKKMGPAGNRFVPLTNKICAEK